MIFRWLTCRLFAGIVFAAVLLADQAATRTVRVTGVVKAVHSYVIQVPTVEGSGEELTLTHLVASGATVKAGDLLAEFDDAPQIKLAREAQAKFDDLSHQVEQKRAELRNNAEKRNSDLLQAEADLNKAEIEIRKGPILSDIDQQKNEVKLADAKEHVASLQRSNHAHGRAEAADLRILELQRDRQKVAVDRQENNAQKLSLRSPIAGMVALENTFRNNSMGHAQEGDRLWGGLQLLRVFDPTAMIVQLSVGEPDGAILVPGSRALVHIDAFPEVALPAHFESASPVATAGFGIEVKTFTARFVLDKSDPHVLPDLSVAADIEVKQ